MLPVYGIIWDMDGVLVDSGEFHYQAWVVTLKDFHIPFSAELFRITFGMNNTGVLTTLLGRSPEPQLLEEVADQKEACFRELIRGHIHPMKGVVAWLSQLQAWGLRQAVASSAPAANIETILGETGIGPYFNAVLTGMDMPAKPDPALFLKAAEAIGSAPERCVVVEDAIAGVQAAKRAGMACIAVLTTNPAGALSQADVIAPNLEALPVETVRQLLHLPPAGK